MKHFRFKTMDYLYLRKKEIIFRIYALEILICIGENFKYLQKKIGPQYEFRIKIGVYLFLVNDFNLYEVILHVCLVLKCIKYIKSGQL